MQPNEISTMSLALQYPDDSGDKIKVCYDRKRNAILADDGERGAIRIESLGHDIEIPVSMVPWLCEAIRSMQAAHCGSVPYEQH